MLFEAGILLYNEFIRWMVNTDPLMVYYTSRWFSSLFFLNLFFSCWLVGGKFILFIVYWYYLLVVNIVNKVIYRGINCSFVNLFRCCKYLAKLISIYKRMILFSNILNLLISKYLYSKIRKCLGDMEILKISYNEMKKNEWK